MERGGAVRGYHGPVSGTKRSMGEGLGSDANGFVSPTNKRCVMFYCAFGLNIPLSFKPCLPF